MKYFIFFICFFAMIGCSHPTHVANLEFYRDTTQHKTEVYRHGHPFNGDAFNSEETFSVSAKNGRLISFTLYDKAGHVLVYESPTGERKYYDMEGLQIKKGKSAVLFPGKDAELDSLKSKYVLIQTYE